MKKRLAILFASLSLCAIGFVGCGDDSKDIGDKCEAHEDCDAQENLFCQAAKEEGGDKLCAAKIKDGKACVSKDDVCESEGFKCLAKGGEGKDKDKLICQKADSAAEGLDDGAKCAKADDKCKSAGFKCLAKGGDGADKDDLVCKKDESSSSSEGGDDLAKASKDMCLHMVSCKAVGYDSKTEADCEPKADAESGSSSETAKPSEECNKANAAYMKCMTDAACDDLKDALKFASLCGSEMEAVMVKCQGKKDKGEDCTAATDCATMFCQADGEAKKCQAKIADGAECKNADDMCAHAGWMCKDDGGTLKCADPAAVVSTGVDIDGECNDTDKKCKDGLTCDTDKDNTCKIADGQSCTGKTDKCLDSSECKGEAGSEVCTARESAPAKAAKGEACVKEAAEGKKVCDDNLVCEVADGASEGKCKIADGQACESAADCLTDHECEAEEEGEAKVCSAPEESVEPVEPEPV